MEPVILTPIGIIRSPFAEPRGTPIQAAGVRRAAAVGGAGVAGRGEGCVEIFPQYLRGLEHLDEFSHVILICHCRRTRGWAPRVKPYVPHFDSFLAERIGWPEGRVGNTERTRDDGRFQGLTRGRPTGAG